MTMGRASFEDQPQLESIQLDTTTPGDSSLSPDSLSPHVPSEHEHEGVSLPPVDTGKDAMLFLAACFIIECLVWGFPFAFGIFQNYYSTHEPFKGSSSIAAIGTTAMGTMYLTAPLVFPLMRLYPKQNRYGPLAGLLIMCAALALSSFAQTVWHLILTQGVLFAIGGSISYGPCILYMDEWFVKRKGLAFSTMWAGSGLGGFAIPLLLEFLLGRYGLRTTLRIWAVALFVLTIPVVYFIKPRLPVTVKSNYNPFRLGFLLDRSFLMYQAANIVEALGFFMPGLYLPSYASSILGSEAFPAASTILAVNVASVFGCIAMGVFVDRFHPTTCIMISTVGTVIGTFLLWGFATNMAVLYIFCVIYGFFAGSYTSTWTGVIKQVTSKPSQPGTANAGSAFDPVIIFGYLAAGRGIGNVVSGPLSEALVKGMAWQGQAAGAYGSGYGPVIAFTGATAVIGGTSFLWKRIGWM
ncbi:major facilitator superfamily domain-containing protein [Trichoderma compactum]